MTDRMAARAADDRYLTLIALPVWMHRGGSMTSSRLAVLARGRRESLLSFGLAPLKCETHHMRSVPGGGNTETD